MIYFDGSIQGTIGEVSDFFLRYNNATIHRFCFIRVNHKTIAFIAQNR